MWEEIMKVSSMGKGIAPEMERGISMSKETASHVSKNAIATLSNTILLRGIREGVGKTSTD
jgi:hypothetical protein